MKKLLLCGSLLAVGSVFAQYSEDFQGTSGTALPAGWSQNTAATDGGFLTGTDLSSQYFPVPTHTRYVGTNDDACDCDKATEELISSSFVVPASGVLAFEYVLPGGYGETAAVGISTNGGVTNTQVAALAATGGAWMTGTASLSAYVGQTVNIVWTYHDAGVWAYGLMIDDVDVFTPAAVDMEMTSLNLTSTILAGNATIAGTVTSWSGNNITSIDVTWDDGGTPNAQTFAVNLNYGDTYNFTHGTQLAAAAGTTYNLNVCVTAAADANASNNCLTGSVSAVSALVAKVTVGEEKTGEWCGWCPRGAVALANMSLTNPTDFIGIAVHNGDGMTVASYDGNIDTYVPGGYPGGGVDRVETGDPSDFSAMHAARVSQIPPASISVNASLAGNTITVIVTADFVGGLSGDYRLASVLIEDNVTGAGQANYYNDGASGAMQYPNTGSMPNFNWVGGGATVNPVYHDHVARALGNDQINGSAGSLPGTITAGTQQSYTYTFTKPAAWKIADMHAVGMLVNAATGEILNAGEDAFANALNELKVTNFDVNVMPNPTNGVTAIVLNLEEAAEVSLVIVDIVGNVVFNSGNDNLAAGSYPTSIDLGGQADGVYFAKVSVNGAVKTVKINLVK